MRRGERVPLHSFGCPRIHYIDYTGLKFTNTCLLLPDIKGMCTVPNTQLCILDQFISNIFYLLIFHFYDSSPKNGSLHLNDYKSPSVCVPD